MYTIIIIIIIIVHRSSNSTDSNYKELKTQIQSALEEAIRLRADTETLCKRMLPNK